MTNRVDIHRYEFVDSLRGLAILLVIVTHVASISRPSLPILRLMAARGAYGVQLFYIVSALTLFLSMHQRTRVEARPVLNFFIRRIFRIVPLFYLSVLVYALIEGNGPSYWAPNGLSWWHYVSTLLFLNGWHPETINAVVPLGWSIAIEMTFYPLIPYLYQKVRNIGAAVFFVVASLVLQSILVLIYKPILLKIATGYTVEAYFYLWFFAQLPIFGLGILVYLVLRDQPMQNKNLGAALILTFLFMYMAFLQTSSHVNAIPDHFFYGLAFATLTLGLCFNPLKLFVNPFTQWAGKVSYSMYLVHFIFLPYLRVWLPLEGLGKTAQFALHFLALLFISSAISLLTYHFIEVPGMKLGKRLVRKMEDVNSPVSDLTA